MATTPAVFEDAPWNAFTNICLTDVNGTPLWNLDGYASYLARTYGGYKNFRPDQSSFGYTTPSIGASGTGNFKCKFELPLEFGTDGLGCLPNMDGSACYRLNLTYNNYYSASGTPVFTTAPTTLPSATTLLEMKARVRPASVDQLETPQQTQPPASGTLQFWTSQTFSVVSGQNTIQLSRVGNLIRNHILVFRSSTNSTRATAETDGTVPTVIEFDWDAGIRHKINVDTQRQLNYELFGFDVPNGVICFPNTDDPDGLAGHEYGNHWMQTVGSTLLRLQFTSSHAGTLQVITNDIVPANNAVFSAPVMGL